MHNSEKRADAEKRAIIRSDDPMVQYMSSVHASATHPMIEMEQEHAGSSSSRKRPSDNHDHKHKRHKHKHQKHKEKHRKKKREKHKETHRHKRNRHAEKAKRTRPGRSSSSSDSSGHGSDGSNRSSAKHGHSSSPGIGPPLPPTGPEIGPPPPPPVNAALIRPEAAAECRPTHEVFSSLGTMSAVACFQRREAPGGGVGHPLSAASRALRCLVCGVEAFGEATFMQHLLGRDHQKANQGRTGFAGLACNSTGRIPPLVNHVLRAAATSLGMDPDGSSGPATGATAEDEEPPPPPWAPPSRIVHIPATVEAPSSRRV